MPMIIVMPPVGAIAVPHDGRIRVPSTHADRRRATLKPVEPPIVEPSGVSVRALFMLMRPRQWTKSVLVFGAPAAAGIIFTAGAMISCLVAAVAFALVSSAVYCMNDARDVAEDRLHPKKSKRPIAAGLVSVRQAWALGAVLLVAGLAMGTALAPLCGAVLALYVAAQVAYSFGAKAEPVVELVIVASGFVLRMIAGGLAVGVPLSAWFLTVAAGGALLVVTSKRLAELKNMGTDAGSHRAVLAEYGEPFLRMLVGICGTIVILGYALWAFGGVQGFASASGAQTLLLQLSTVPFLTAVLRFVLIADKGDGGEPEEVVLAHRALQVMGALWVLLFLAGTTIG
ncbi:MAG: decaprenyl-phosphate phosphoribosyltransferase [Solirubrobacteraceae bacterium]